MSASIRTTAAAALAATALALAAAAPAGAQEPEPSGTDVPATGETSEFVPFVTDFGLEPRPAGEPVVINPRAGEQPPAPAARGWSDVALGSAVGFAFAVLLAAGGLALWRLRDDDAVEAEG